MKWWQDKRRVGLLAVAVAALLAVVAVVLVAVRTDRTAAPPPDPSTSPATASTTAPDMTSFAVYFHQGSPDDPREVVAVPRSVPKTAAVATAALTELLRGPTEAERTSGHWSMFGNGTADHLRSVRVVDGVAYADFRDFREAIPNASSSFGGAALLAELDSTLRQFPTVKSTVHSFDGDVSAFYHWLQLTPPSQDDVGDATAEARRFLLDVAGMRAVFTGTARRTGDLAEVTCYPPRANDVTVPSTGQPTVVALRRDNGRWTVTAAAAGVIQVDGPRSGDVVATPLAVSGRAHVFEGNVTVRVLVDKASTEIGRGFVTGGGDALQPFTGTIPFAQPNGGEGWVLFQEFSAANGDVVLTTAVRVGFGVAQPKATGNG
ncbi:Gmad2 immunoglobulin-like domain-containing protein [Lentzea sp. HUAS TT2]|uniref:Gmad2 immunoglobulin-like domain-containing protein n=1 Tax=Lentzea sp. HUAS TT2 TaxID=3447454 RepID=UPI003F717C04